MVRYHSLLLLAAAAALSSTTTLVSAQNCNLDCGVNDCVEGSALFEDHFRDPDGSTFDFHKTTNVNDEHCACPPGSTGVLCETIYQSCSIGNHKCYHGGKCEDGLVDVFGNDQLFCDCEDATDDEGNQYAGKYCEHKATTFCSDDDSHFCLNEGDCNPDYPQPGYGDPCFCQEKWEGDHCQFKEGRVPKCDLECENGMCVLGEKNSEEMKEHYQFWDLDASAKDYMHCKCHAGFDGQLCEIEKIECGDDHCFHGGTCIEREVDEHTLHHCDCATASPGSDSYAGRMCQYKATEYCTKDEGFNGLLFCVNDGQCKKDPYDGCDCDDGYAGFACEFVVSDFDESGDPDAPAADPNADPDDEVFEDEEGKPIVDYFADEDPCDLQCKNGLCRNGIKELGFLSGIATHTAHLNETSTEDFQHCVCPNGFVGLYCEHKVELCPMGERLCLHGGLCTTNGDQSSCDCSTTDSDLASVFAGDSCEHPATSVCTIGDPGPAKPLSFCTNFGSCLKNVTADQTHSGCMCKDGWEGPHCEIKISTDAVSSTKTSSSNDDDGSLEGTGVFFVTVLALAVVVLSLVLATVLIRNRSKRRSETTNGLFRQSGYRDSPDINLSPHRMSVVSKKAMPETYSASSHSSSRDPMATHLAPRQPPQSQPEIYIGPPRDEDGHELHSVDIV